MKSMLEKLYYGEIFRNEDILPRGEGVKQISKKLSKLEDEFIGRLDKTEFKLYDELSSSHNERDSYFYAETFIEGFRIGARIMMEVLSDE